MNKVCAFLLLVWPYLFFPFVFLGALTESSLTWVWIYCLLTPVVYIANIVCACKAKDIRGLARWNMALKLVHIPAYLSIFFLGVIMAGQLLVGIPFGLILVPILAVIDYLLLFTTSTYGANALVKARKAHAVSIGFMIVNLVLHFICVLDVVSSVIVYCKLRKGGR